MAKKKNKVDVETYPTVFVFQGVPRYFEDGSMLELQSGVTDDEWKQIVEDTVGYHIFVECLKSVAFPLLKENWTTTDECWRLQFELAVSRIKNIDPFAVMAIDSDDIKKKMSGKMARNGQEVLSLIDDMRKINTMAHESAQKADLSGPVVISDL